jgi:hypothetical protein
MNSRGTYRGWKVALSTAAGRKSISYAVSTESPHEVRHAEGPVRKHVLFEVLGQIDQYKDGHPEGYPRE